MVLYSIDSTEGTFNREEVIDEFISAIWTERWIEAGEVEVVMPAMHKNLKLLAPGELLGCGGSRELMLLETRSIEAGLVTAKGKTIEAYFDELPIPAITMVARGGDIMKGVVSAMQDRSFGEAHVHIDGLSVASPDPNETGGSVIEDIPKGPVYTTLVTLGKKYQLGQSVVWTKIEDGDHKLVYTTRQGKDLTGQADNAVRFSTALENLGNAKQLLSIAGSKNIFIVNPPDWVDPDLARSSLIWNYSRFDGSIFKYRVLEIDCNDITKESLPGDNDVERMTHLYRMMDARQAKAVDEHKKIKAVDGEITPESQFVYKRDYDLGDMVEMQGEYGEPVKGMITEHITSSDESGGRNYPTVIAPADDLGAGTDN